ncbi:hypothetical protein H6P81_008907 [Aristolochia fimbriata]|uniref:Uncharacterized protein n=1 Tax=Aristolochia fimbriata TaxID=158543 RepID=A0AAV7EJB4_ARIFI|nr:hypothetical protein H6P81_008907 [Aristolochia fimbriata]
MNDMSKRMSFSMTLALSTSWVFSEKLEIVVKSCIVKPGQDQILPNTIPHAEMHSDESVALTFSFSVAISIHVNAFGSKIAMGFLVNYSSGMQMMNGYLM